MHYINPAPHVFTWFFLGGGKGHSLESQVKILGIIFNFFILSTCSTRFLFQDWLHVCSMEPSYLPCSSQFKHLGLRLTQWHPNQLTFSILPSADPFSLHHHSPASNPKMASSEYKIDFLPRATCSPLCVSIILPLMSTFALCLRHNEFVFCILSHPVVFLSCSHSL